MRSLISHTYERITINYLKKEIRNNKKYEEKDET